MLAMSAVGSPFDIPKLKENDWDSAFHVDLLLPVDTPLRTKEEFSASAKLGWNDEGLMVQVTVQGLVSNGMERLDELWKGDSVEIYLSPAHDSPDRCQWVFAPALDERFPEVRSYLHDYRSAPSLRRLPSEARGSSRKTETGYEMEVLLPWASLAIEPYAGREVTCQIMVSNFKRGEEQQDHLVWYPMYGAYYDSRKMHRLRLSDRAHPPLKVRGNCRTDLWRRTMEVEITAPGSMAGKTLEINGFGKAVLEAWSNGYSRTVIKGPAVDAVDVPVEMDGSLVGVVPVRLAAGMSPSRRLTMETKLEAGRLVIPDGCRVLRRQAGAGWNEVPGDEPMLNGLLYEYAVLRDGDYPASDYFFAGTEVPATDHRGKAVLIVEEAIAVQLAPEIDRLLMDWVGDGWDVERFDAPGTGAVSQVKAVIDSSRADAVMLLGRVPVPYSGNLAPDGHHDHAGAWPADVYYATKDEGWTDSQVDTGSAELGPAHRNVPGDGKFDQSEIPSEVIRSVGRLDFKGLSVFKEKEEVLFKRYLDRLHAYRHCLMEVEQRAWIQNDFFGHPERFAYSGWQNLTTLVGAEHTADAKWPNFPREMQILFAGFGSGGPDWMKGFGHSHELAKQPLNAVFSLMFGSYFGDWMLDNNIMRSVLASDGGGLACAWSGRPHWYMHALGMGGTIGDCLKVTQNNGAGGYQPTGGFPKGVHIALLGDPTLRLHRLAPPSSLRAEPEGDGIVLNWSGQQDGGMSYHVYRALNKTGPYERITARPLDECRYLDKGGAAGLFYMVRAIGLQRAVTGSYYNMSQGVFVQAVGK